MAGKYQIRSVSLPSRSHPVSVRIEQELNSLRSYEASSKRSLSEVCCGLTGLEEVYNCVDELLTMQSTQESLSNCRNENWSSDLFDESVKILDVCSTLRETLLMAKGHVQDMQSALRRRKCDSSVEKSIFAYSTFRKRMQKNATKMIASLKKMNHEPHMRSQDDESSRLIKVLTEVTQVTILVFESLLSFLAAPSSSKTTKWSLVASLMNKKISACQNQTVNELSSVDDIISKSSSNGEVTMQAALESLTALEISIGCVEDRLESIFRCLVRLRVSLLNNMSN